MQKFAQLLIGSNKNVGADYVERLSEIVWGSSNALASEREIRKCY